MLQPSGPAAALGLRALVQVACAVEDVAAAAVQWVERTGAGPFHLRHHPRRLARLGWPAVLTACTAAGVRYAFHDARTDLGHLVEVYEPTERVRSLYARVALSSEGWDGRDPVRALT